MANTKAQRLAIRSNPGTLLKRAIGIAQRMAPKDVSEREPSYLAQIRKLPCLKCGTEECGTAAHVRMQSAAHGKRGGIAKKPADKWALPLCESCHTLDPDSQHKVGEQIFWNAVGINPLLLCVRLYTAKGDFVRMRAIVIQTIAERQT